ncbi:MAG: hypothetical protein IKB74_03635 [Lentisphaeria bacterium]|nr:hypothetical protein [Lentisphaeria bacterium]
MAKFIALFCLFVFVAGCSCPATKVKHTATEEKEELLELASDRHTVESRFFKLTLFPGVSGGIENIVLKGQNTPLLWGGKLVQVSNGPLVVRPQAFGVLFSEKFWRADEVISNMKVQKTAADSVTLYCPEYGTSSAELVRHITLGKDELSVNFKVDVKFLKEPRKGYSSPWLNLMPARDMDWVTALPGRGNEAVNGLGTKTYFPATAIYRGGVKGGGQNTYFAPARAWAAVSSAKKGVAVAIIHDYPLEKCTLYSWKGHYEGTVGRTIEFILPELKLDKELRGSWNYRLLIFPRITDLREICNDTAIEYRQNGKMLTMRFCPVRKVPAQKVELFLNEKGKTTALGAKTLAALDAGKVGELTFELPQDKLSGTISGTLNGKPFSILPVIK